MGGRKSEYLNETIWSSTLLLTLRPVSISRASPGSHEHCQHQAARHQAQRGPGASSGPFLLCFCDGECLLDLQCCAEKHQRAASSGEVPPERHHRSGASPETLFLIPHAQVFCDSFISMEFLVDSALVKSQAVVKY